MRFVTRNTSKKHIIIARKRSFSGCMISATQLESCLGRIISFLGVSVRNTRARIVLSYGSLLSGIEGLFVRCRSFTSQPRALRAVLSVLDLTKFEMRVRPPVISPRPFMREGICVNVSVRLGVFTFESDRRVSWPEVQRAVSFQLIWHKLHDWRPEGRWT